MILIEICWDILHAVKIFNGLRSSLIYSYVHIMNNNKMNPRSRIYINRYCHISRLMILWILSIEDEDFAEREDTSESEDFAVGEDTTEAAEWEDTTEIEGFAENMDLVENCNWQIDLSLH